MAREPEDIIVAGDGDVYVAPIGTPFPTFGDTPAGPWVQLGYFTEEGLKLSFKRDSTKIMAWQSGDPVRIRTKQFAKSVGFTCQETNADTVALALGGGSWEEGTPGVYTYTPPAESDTDERAVLAIVKDGDKTFWWEFPRAGNFAGVEINATRGKEQNLPIEMDVLAPSGGDDPYNIVTDDSTFAPAS